MLKKRYLKNIAFFAVALALSAGGSLKAASQGALGALNTLELDSKGSSLQFFCESFLHNFHGEAKGMSGCAQVIPDAIPPIQSANLTFKTTELKTFIAARDEKMYDWLNVKAHPEATFQLQSVKPLGGDYKAADAKNPAQFQVAGTLNLNGVNQPIQGTAKGWREKDRLVVSGDVVVDTLKFGLPQIRMAMLTVGTNVKVSYAFRFVLPPAYAKQ